MAAETGRGQYYLPFTGRAGRRLRRDSLIHLCIVWGGGVEMEPPRAGNGLPGQTITYTHSLTNAGGGIFPEVFSISAASSLWSPAGRRPPPPWASASPRR